MGHLINPVAFRLGWFAGWCDSWYSDHLYYPEFLHDIFRVRLFLNYFFSLLLFEKSALSFSHFEFFHKYTFLTLRVFYYDGILMEGLFAFQADLSNRYLRRKFKRTQRRYGNPIGSRYGRMFLAIFFSFFRFSTFFKSAYLKQSIPQTLALKRHSFKEWPQSKVLYEQAQLRFVLRLRAKFTEVAKNRALREGRPYVHRRVPLVNSFPSYETLFKPQWTPRRFFRGKGKGKPFFNFRSNSYKRGNYAPQGSKFTQKGKWSSSSTKNSYKSDSMAKGKGQHYPYNKNNGRRSATGIFNATSKKRVDNWKNKKMSTYRQVAHYSDYKSKQSHFWKNADRPMEGKATVEKSWEQQKAASPWLREPISEELRQLVIEKYFTKKATAPVQKPPVKKQWRRPYRALWTTAPVQEQKVDRPMEGKATVEKSWEQQKAASPWLREPISEELRQLVIEKYFTKKVTAPVQKQRVDRPMEGKATVQKAWLQQRVGRSNSSYLTKGKDSGFFNRSHFSYSKHTDSRKSIGNSRQNTFRARAGFSKAKGQTFTYVDPHFGRCTIPAPFVAYFKRSLVRRRRRRIAKLFRFTLKYCRVSRLNLYLKVLRVRLTKGLALAPELKILLIFIVLFRRMWALFHGKQFKLSVFDFLKELYFTASFLFFFNGYNFKIFSSILVCLLKQAGLHYLSFRIGIFLISNETVTAVFLANFVGRKLAQGYRVRSVVSPVMKDLYKSSLSMEPPKVGEVGLLKKEYFSKGYRSGVAKAFLLKFFFIYKRLYGKFFWLSNTWLNFYFYKNLVRFFDKFSGNLPLLLGSCKKFMLQKHGFLFFFNFDNAFITKNLSFVFNDLFFDFTNRSSMGHSIYFFFICDDLFSHSNVLFFGQSWKKLSLDHWYVATIVFFNRLVRYSLWRYKRSWLWEVNGINKLKMRGQKPFKKQGLLGFKFHLRGRFTRKQKASSLWYVRGKMPLTLSSASIDYAFRAYPIKNSLVSIKVWLYKGGFCPQWFIRQF